jgi:hypothetical protein
VVCVQVGVQERFGESVCVLAAMMGWDLHEVRGGGRRKVFPVGHWHCQSLLGQVTPSYSVPIPCDLIIRPCGVRRIRSGIRRPSRARAPADFRWAKQGGGGGVMVIMMVGDDGHFA